MRTKALILSALLGVAGVTSAIAQGNNVYSVNVVGYMTLTLNQGFSLIANQLDNGAGNIATNLMGAGPFPNQARIYKFNPATSSYKSLQWNTTGPNANKWTPAADASTMTMAPGEGVFFSNPSATPVVVTFVGEVMQSKGQPLVNPLGLGFDIYSSMVPQQGGVTTVHNLQALSDERVYKYNPVSGAYNSSRWATSGPPPQGPYPKWLPSEPSLNVGEAFFLDSKGARDWTRIFDVQ